MTPSLLLRLVIYAIGLSAASTGINQLVYYLHTVLADPLDAATWISFASPILAFVVTPFAVALLCLGFAGAITKFLLGAEARVELSLGEHGLNTLLTLFAKAVGLYVFSTHLGSTVATVFEFIAVKNGNTHFNEAQVMTDGISNGIALVAAYFLSFRTKEVVGWIGIKTEPQK